MLCWVTHPLAHTIVMVALVAVVVIANANAAVAVVVIANANAAVAVADVATATAAPLRPPSPAMHNVHPRAHAHTINTAP
jgi:hypothetical protein